MQPRHRRVRVSPKHGPRRAKLSRRLTLSADKDCGRSAYVQLAPRTPHAHPPPCHFVCGPPCVCSAYYKGEPHSTSYTLIVATHVAGTRSTSSPTSRDQVHILRGQHAGSPCGGSGVSRSHGPLVASRRSVIYVASSVGLMQLQTTQTLFDHCDVHGRRDTPAFTSPPGLSDDDAHVHVQILGSSHTGSFVDSDSHEATGGLDPEPPRPTSVCLCPPISSELPSISSHSAQNGTDANAL